MSSLFDYSQYEVKQKLELSSPFRDKSFRDVTVLNSYLKRTGSRLVANSDIDMISHIIEKYSEMRGVAERCCRTEEYSYVINRNDVLPISMKSISECLDKDESEPPFQLIVEIAQEHYQNISRLGESLRKVLRRERSKAFVGKAQQIDSACLVWLSKQPGYTTAQKAGSKQEILSIIRRESYDTLENRVFKDFLRLCQNECNVFIRLYGEEYPNSSRLKDVKKLFSLTKSLLALEAMDGISALSTNPKPNYVLQNNATYYSMWILYMRLRQKYQIIEEVWPHRQMIVKEYIALLLDLFFYSNTRSNNHILTNSYWISRHVDRDYPGFLSSNRHMNCYGFDDYSVVHGFFSGMHNQGRDEDIPLYLIGNITGEMSIRFYYVPKNVTSLSLQDFFDVKTESNRLNIIYYEDTINELDQKAKNCIMLNSGTDFENSLREGFERVFKEWKILSIF